MASEFWFFSQLHRLGYEAYITLGNTKAVDIVVVLNDQSRTRLTFDVKGKESFQAGSYQYLPLPPYAPNHFFAFIGLEIKHQMNRRISFTRNEPKCFIVEGKDLPTIAAPWSSISGSAHGFGFYPWLLTYLKSSGGTKHSSKGLANFKNTVCPNGINFTAYQQSIMTLDDFESRYHQQK